MTTSPDDVQDAERYRVFLLRLWRDNAGPWHASLQAADAATPHRFADAAGTEQTTPPDCGGSGA